MASILYAWELGAAFGHIGPFLSVAGELRAKGHSVRIAAADLAQASRLLADTDLPWLQAPGITERAGNAPPLNYADILLRFGYADPDDLLGALVAWRELLQLSGASVLVADHAPTAILAARTLDIPVVLFGGGFAVPPPTSPTPNMRPWARLPAAELRERDTLALRSINAMLTRFGQPPLGQLCDLFSVAEPRLLAYPELDHYEQRTRGRYWGMIPNSVTTPPPWPQAAGVRAFAYLRRDGAHFAAAMAALSRSGFSVLAVVPDADETLRARYESDRFRVVNAPVDLRSAAEVAELGITYASPATTSAFLLAGKPVLMLPTHLEQYLFALRVRTLGAGLFQHPEQAPEQLDAMLGELLRNPGFREKAREFSDRHQGEDGDPTRIASNIAMRIIDIATSSAATSQLVPDPPA